LVTLLKVPAELWIRNPLKEVEAAVRYGPA
jgi:hypothetical protein